MFKSDLILLTIVQFNQLDPPKFCKQKKKKLISETSGVKLKKSYKLLFYILSDLAKNKLKCVKDIENLSEQRFVLQSREMPHLSENYLACISNGEIMSSDST